MLRFTAAALASKALCGHTGCGVLGSPSSWPSIPGDEYFHFDRDEEARRVRNAKVQEDWVGSSRMLGWLGSKFTSTDLSETALVRYSVLLPDDPDFKRVEMLLRPKEGEDSTRRGFAFDPSLDRAIGSFVSMAVGDALGAPLEFQAVRYPEDGVASSVPVLSQLGPDEGKRLGAFGMFAGQWTDDASMGACIADSLLWNGGFDPYDLKTRFVSWWNFGYNNANRLAKKVDRSVGLGGNISMSFDEFRMLGTVYTEQGDKNTSGNGSLMRNGAVPVYYHDDLATGLDVARKQSYLTHQGTEAAELCAALTHLVIYAINNPDKGKGEILKTFQRDFKSDLAPSVTALVRSEQEPDGGSERNWRWATKSYRYAPGRARRMPGYIGSYSMDAMAMALHCVWATDSYEKALLMAANRCGDADTVCDITGQIAGAIYGYSAIPDDWLQTLNRWDGNEFAVKAFKLYFKNPCRYPADHPARGLGLDGTSPSK